LYEDFFLSQQMWATSFQLSHPLERHIRTPLGFSIGK